MAHKLLPRPLEIGWNLGCRRSPHPRASAPAALSREGWKPKLRKRGQGREKRMETQKALGREKVSVGGREGQG